MAHNLPLSMRQRQPPDVSPRPPGPHRGPRVGHYETNERDRRFCSRERTYTNFHFTLSTLQPIAAG